MRRGIQQYPVNRRWVRLLSGKDIGGTLSHGTIPVFLKISVTQSVDRPKRMSEIKLQPRFVFLFPISDDAQPSANRRTELSSNTRQRCWSRAPRFTLRVCSTMVYFDDLIHSASICNNSFMVLECDSLRNTSSTIFFSKWKAFLSESWL